MKEKRVFKILRDYRKSLQKKNTSPITIFTTPPSEEVRTMAEWEEIQALTITWSTGYNIQEEPFFSQIVEVMLYKNVKSSLFVRKKVKSNLIF